MLQDRFGAALGFSPLFDSVGGCQQAIASTMACASEALVVRAAPMRLDLRAVRPRVA